MNTTQTNESTRWQLSEDLRAHWTHRPVILILMVIGFVCSAALLRVVDLHHRRVVRQLREDLVLRIQATSLRESRLKSSGRFEDWTRECQIKQDLLDKYNRSLFSATEIMTGDLAAPKEPSSNRSRRFRGR